MSQLFDARALEQRYSFFDECPEALLQQAITLPLGSLDERVRGVLSWRRSLLTGRLPADSWPRPDIAAPIQAALREMDIARFCRDQPELVDELLSDILRAFTSQTELVFGEIARRLRELEQLERARLRREEAKRARREKRERRGVRLSEEMLAELRKRAERESLGTKRPADQELLAIWGDRVRAWAEVSEVFGDLGELMGRGWDMARSVLRHTGWLDLARLRKLIEQLPQVREIVRSLGRLQDSTREDSVVDRIFAPVLRIEQERREVRVPNVPAEMRGIERSGEISRMLPVEAAILGHSKLRMLWHARRAERALITYRVEGIEIEQHPIEREVMVANERKRPRPERGPILAVIDTSGSMHGVPERVAKALVLEALRTAHSEKRRCYLYSYGGPGEVLEHELSLSADGVGRLLEFLSMSFGGGTDAEGVIPYVTTRLRQEHWKKADVIFVSDGEWPAPASMVAGVRAACDSGTRFHGVQIGNRGRTGLHEICDPVHVFTDWAAVCRD
ncbi:MAG: hypothetical protein RLY21_529 [Planctomycetota bacterium]|jgi:uncharacterized protein with von Willebrand factor type A (vWA) domain